MTIQENIKRVDRLRKKISNHPMCARFAHDNRYYYVIFPDGDFGINNGLRASKSDGQAVALQKMLDEMERVWMESYP